LLSGKSLDPRNKTKEENEKTMFSILNHRVGTVYAVVFT
jgi:hypothetical protein